MIQPFKMLAAVLSLAASTAFAVPVVLQPDDGKDSQVVDGVIAGTNFGTSMFVMDNWVGNLRAAALLQFDLGAYAGATVTDAKLGLFHLNNPSPGTTYKLFRVTSAWDESTVTFNTAPSFDAVETASLTIGDGLTDVFREWDLTALVNGWLSGSYANHGVWIEEVPIGGPGIAYFASSDHNIAGFAPYLAFDAVVNGVPEPTSLLLLGAALVAAGAARRRAS